MCVWESVYLSAYLGLFLSLGCDWEWTGLVSVWTDKKKLLFSSLIALPPANIPFVFPPFPLLCVFFVVAVGLGKGSAFASVSCPSSFLLYSIPYFSVAQWLAVDRLVDPGMIDFKPAARFDWFFQVFMYLLMVVLLGQWRNVKPNTKVN